MCEIYQIISRTSYNSEYPAPLRPELAPVGRQLRVLEERWMPLDLII